MTLKFRVAGERRSMLGSWPANAAARKVACPREPCGARPGEECRTLKGGVVDYAHSGRVERARAAGLFR